MASRRRLPEETIAPGAANRNDLSCGPPPPGRQDMDPEEPPIHAKVQSNYAEDGPAARDHGAPTDGLCEPAARIRVTWMAISQCAGSAINEHTGSEPPPRDSSAARPDHRRIRNATCLQRWRDELLCRFRSGYIEAIQSDRHHAVQSDEIDKLRRFVLTEFRNGLAIGQLRQDAARDQG